ncbi:MAG: TlpA disulfide reductase family protein [Pirellulales bacterium]
MIALPRYKLNVGDQLTYRTTCASDGERQSNGSGRSSPFAVEWNFYVIARDANGAWRIVFSESRAPEDEFALGEGAAHRIDCDGFFDMDDDGRMIENWTITPLANPTVVFPRLPADHSEIASGWHSTLEFDLTNCRYAATSADAATEQSIWQFASECHTQFDPVYQVLRQRDYVFDLKRGLVTRIGTAFQRGAPASTDDAAGRDFVHLVDVTTRAGFDSTLARQEADRYFERCGEYQRLVDLAFWDLPQASHWFAKAADVLAGFERVVSVDFIGEFVRRKLALHKRECAGMLSDADKLAPLIGARAPEWHAVDLEGNTHTTQGHGGKVLVLCFWNRGCTWSLRALLAVNALANEMRGRPITFLSVSADRNIDEAAYACQALKIGLPTIMDVSSARALSAVYGVDSYPTTIVIDQNGIIQRVRAGYSHRLSSTLALELRRLVHEESCVSCD